MRSYTTVQVAKILGISRDTLYRWMRDRKIKGSQIVRMGAGAEYQVRLWTDREIAQIKKYMTENYCKGRGPRPKKRSK